MIEQELFTRFDSLKSSYESLYESLKEERHCLPKAKVEKLQVIVQKIEKTVSEINQERTEIITVLSKFTGTASPSLHIDSLLRFISPMYHYHFQTIYEDIDRLAGEIKRYAKENRFIIEDSLSFIDETIHKVMGAKEKNTTYDNEMKLRKLKHNNLLLSKEV